MKLTPFKDGLRVTPFYDAKGVAWRIDVKDGHRIDGVDIPPGGDWAAAIKVLNTLSARHVTVAQVRALVEEYA